MLSPVRFGALNTSNYIVIPWFYHTFQDALQIELSEAGPLTQSVHSFIRDMHSPAKNATLSPSALFGQVKGLLYYISIIM